MRSVRSPSKDEVLTAGRRAGALATELLAQGAGRVFVVRRDDGIDVDLSSNAVAAQFDDAFAQLADVHAVVVWKREADLAVRWSMGGLYFFQYTLRNDVLATGPGGFSMGKHYDASDFIAGFDQGLADNPRGLTLAINTIPFYF